MVVDGGIMAGPDIFTADIFRLADLCIQEGLFPGFEDWRYVLLLRFEGGARCEVRRAGVNAVLPMPCRVWIAKGGKRLLLGDSHSLPGDLSDGVCPPFTG